MILDSKSPAPCGGYSRIMPLYVHISKSTSVIGFRFQTVLIYN